MNQAPERLAGAPAAPAGGRIGLIAIYMGVFLGALDQTVVATLLPPIVLDLEIPFTRLADAAWIVTGYLLGYTVAMPLIGRLADIHGRTRVFLGCLALFAVASLACGAAPSLETLIAARALQAIGGGAMLPVTLALAGDLADTRRRGLTLGVVGAIAEAGGVLGPLYGALLVQWVSWRWIFFLNVPLCLLIGALVYRAHWSGPHPETRYPGGGGRLDLAGGLLLGGSLAALTIGLSQEQVFSQPTPVAIAALAVGLVLGVAFLLAERRVATPLIDLVLFRSRPFAAANAVNVLIGACLIVAMVDVPLWSATILQRTAAEGGLLLLRLTLLIPIGAVAAGLASRRVAPRPIALVGLAAVAASLWLIARWPATVDDGTMTRDLALGGLGFGILLVPVTTVAIAWGGTARAGVAAALVTLMRMVGMMIGLSALTSYGLGRFHALVGDIPLPLPVGGETAAALAQRQAAYGQAVLQATVSVFHEVFTAAAVLCLVAVLPALALWLPHLLRERATVGDAVDHPG